MDMFAGEAFSPGLGLLVSMTLCGAAMRFFTGLRLAELARSANVP